MDPAGNGRLLELVEQITAACGITASSIEHLATGAQSQVWLVTVGVARYTLRIGVARPGERNTYEAEHGIRRRLVELGGRVARPIYTNRDKRLDTAVKWSLDEYVEGAPIPAGELAREACREIGELLAKLHSIPVRGFGLLRNQRGELTGSRPNPREGILSRLHEPWPFTGVPLESHPIIAERPDFLPRLHTAEPTILELVDSLPQPVVLHTDLHPGQFLFKGGRLAALVDFGDATAGPPAWDVASFAYFFGWQRAGWMLEGYTDDRARRDQLRAEARLFALVIALHHAGRAGVLGQRRRMDGAIRYLAEHL